MKLKQSRALERAAVGKMVVRPISNFKHSTNRKRLSTVSGRTCDFLMPHVAQAERMASNDFHLPRRAKHLQLKNFLAALIRLSVGHTRKSEAHNE